MNCRHTQRNSKRNSIKMEKERNAFGTAVSALVAVKIS